MRFKVTVYITCNNYAHFLPQAIESVLDQILSDWELIIIDDGSCDNSHEIAKTYEARFPDQIRTVRHETAQGLFYSANRALEMARGEYFIRLDADDYFDESALLVLAGYLNRNTKIALVYPNYFYIDVDGNNHRFETRKKIGVEAKLLDLPAHGACTMVRTRILKTVGGYSEVMKAQDGHELWLKIARRYPVGNIETPLFYYRQHSHSLSKDNSRVLTNRRKIKRMLVERDDGDVKLRKMAIIPAKNSYKQFTDIVLREVAGRPLIDWTIEAAIEAGFDTICVWTDDPRVASHCEKFEGLYVKLRPEDLSDHDTKLSRVLYTAVTTFEEETKTHPDVVAILNIHCPLRKAVHITEALDTLSLYDSDSVVSVMEDWFLHFTHGSHGLELLNPGMAHQLRLEREALFVDNGAVKVMWRDVLREDDMLGSVISHIVMDQEESILASSESNLLLISHLLEKKNAH